MTIHQTEGLSLYKPQPTLKYAITPVHGIDIAVATVRKMLDGADGGSAQARILQPGEELPMGALPVLVAPTTVFGAVAVERLVQQWRQDLPRPWVVLVADVPAKLPTAARYRLRALGGRLAGVTQLPYLPALRAAASPTDAFKDRSVVRAAEKLRRRLEGN